ncbi:sensor histidine kinase [Salinimicrobium oceani]|uniref:Histidine kinase n=1 Tax=Salinimicrobium oceani TaxID=2722702 RepID=A0ABX1CVY2_9FLAO|nr:histidine kinase [Salinimicrobium oceani]NJW52437.1 histidine kinase [Salinimicrobium oceani]
MNRIKKIFKLVHLALWTLFGLLIVLQLNSDEHLQWRAVTAGTLLTCMYVFYSHFYLLKYSAKRKKRDYFLLLAGIIVTGPIPFVIFHPSGFASAGAFQDYYLMTLVTAVPVFTFLSWLARVTENLVLNTVLKEQLEKQAVQTELSYLKSQIDPHFLFNTLNNIHTLVYKQAATAPEAVLRLASLMRYMIYESNAPTVPLFREITYLQDYISLQQLRYRKHPIVDLEIKGETASIAIAPLLFIHFLENAYKHSPSDLAPGAIQLQVEVRENTLIFRIRNPIGRNAGALQESGGIGLPNIKKRLQLLYPHSHTLETDENDGHYTVLLKIKDLHIQPHERKDHLLHY